MNELRSPDPDLLARADGAKLRTGAPRQMRFLLICVGAAVAIMLVDIWTPRGVTVAALYVIPTAIVQRAGSSLYTMITALVGAVLASIGLVLSPDIGVPLPIVLWDYAVVVVILAATTTLGVIANRRAVQLQKVTELLTMCAWTKKVKDGDEWISIEDYLKKRVGVTITHGISEEGVEKLLGETPQDGEPSP